METLQRFSSPLIFNLSLEHLWGCPSCQHLIPLRYWNLPPKKAFKKQLCHWLHLAKPGLQKNSATFPQINPPCSPNQVILQPAPYRDLGWGIELGFGAGALHPPLCQWPRQLPRPSADGNRVLWGFGVGFWGVSEAHGGYLMQKPGLGGGYGMGLGLYLCPQGVGGRAGCFWEAEGGWRWVPSQGSVKPGWGGKGGCGPAEGGPNPAGGERGAAKTSTAST